MLRFKEIQYSDPLFENLLGEDYDVNNPPAFFDINEIDQLKLCMVAFWDEHHKKMSIGASGSRIGPGRPNVTVSFKRDANGRLDLSNGNYPSKRKVVMKVKYEKEVRFAFGVNKSEQGDGRKLPPFDYTGKKIITRTERDKFRLREIYYIKKMKGENRRSTVWVADPREKGAVYRNDDITKLSGISGKTFEKFEAAGITLVHQLKDLLGDNNKINETATKVKSLSVKRLKTFIALASTCLDEDAPAIKDHRTKENPYLSLHGPDKWEAKCDTTAMVGKVCVTELIDFIFESSKALIGPNYRVYHDALALMTVKDSVQYMKDKGYYNHWILPQLDLMSTVNDELKAYKARPVGNSPELMPLDTSLFAQLIKAVNMHVIATKDYNIGDEVEAEKKFCMATQKTVLKHTLEYGRWHLVLQIL